MQTVLPSKGLKQTLNLLYDGKRVGACVRKAAVNDEIVAGSSRSSCCFVPLRRAYDESTEVWMRLERRTGACTSVARSATQRVGDAEG